MDTLDTIREVRDEFIPARVVIDSNGVSTSPARAEQGWHTRPMVIFVRDDGWTLGCPREYEAVTKAQWAARWVEMWARASRGAMLTPWVLVWRRPNGLEVTAEFDT